LLRVQILGEVRAWRDGQLVELGPAARRAVLGLLALAGGQPVPRTDLVAGVWHGRPSPPSAVNILHTHVKHLRRLFEPERAAGRPATVLRRVGEGYALHVPACSVDVLEFRAELAAAVKLRRSGDLSGAATLLQRAMSRWQGPALADVPILAGHPKLVALAEERRSALGWHAELMISAGRAAEVIGVLEEEAAARPLDEAVQARLILAYGALGRRDEAFTVYHAVRRRLVADLGVDPGPELEGVHADLLRDVRPTIPEADRHGGPPAYERVPPAQLIVDLPVFTGRTAELALLDAVLDAREDRSAYRCEAAGVVVLSGPAGVGKTSLAVHWAHRVASRFPDGQLYLNLRGFHPTGVAVDPMEALRLLLEALEVPATEVPTDLDARAALYRSRLAGRRILILLDNAADVMQVRPLLPGRAPCMAVVTSRNQLAGLVVAEGARPVPLSPLTAAEATDLLVRRIGADRAAREPGAVSEIVERCAGLPLALAVVAARAAIGAGHPLQAYASELHLSAGRLDALSAGDPATDLREVFSWSYRGLGDLPARLFRLLGTHPAADISAAAAASLAGCGRQEAHAALTGLVSASLVLTPVPGRYALHDLVRVYAADLARRADPTARADDASRRLLAHHLHTAYAADRVLNPNRSPIALDEPPPGVIGEPITDRRHAMAWFAEEHAVLLAIVRDAGASGRDTECWQLAWTLWTHLDRRGYWDDLADVALLAIAATGRAAGPVEQAGAYRMLARAYTRLNRLDEARTQLRYALGLCRRAQDRPGQAVTNLNLALVWERQGAYASALDHAVTALAIFVAEGDRAGQVRARSAVGWYHALLGDNAQALSHCQAAMAEVTAIGDLLAAASIWDSLGQVHQRLGDHARAVACIERAIDLYREQNDRHVVGLVLIRLAEARRAQGDTAGERAAWGAALSILAELDPPAAERARVALTALPGEPATARD
jgi:DNA-binding SARP family transcriptional activator/tetratricopeptide (TPR) repeat protein